MTSGSFGRIISQQHTQRIKRLIDETRGTVVFGGKANVAEKYVAPTLVRDVRGDDALMSEEIFGPVLPIVPVKDVDEAIAFINAHDHPLAIYVFTQNEAFKNKIIDNTQSGAVAANEVIIHLRVDGLPFGGIGPSGYGCTTGKFSFDTFTHLRSTIDNPSWVDTFLMAARYPPYKSGSSGKLNELMKPRLPPRPGTVSKRRWGLWSLLALVGALSAVLARTSGRTFFKRG
ncbi:hypothetical protein AcW1_008564 [Taiwanofungus camphoratus]|nr:hypothetical protein AcW1_008564 [Antrodia cinnamomea]KAI0956436.1 hypothetical protein AcV7_006844 [Antrodia cinnamomea]